MASPGVLTPDPLVVQPCLAGDEDAGRDLYRRHHPRLVRYLDRLRWPCPGRADQTEEVLAQLWYGLLINHHQLRQFDPARGHLAAFLVAVARQQRSRLSRATRRPGRTLAPLPSGDIAASPADRLPEPTLLEEFVGRLTEAERRFYQERLLTVASGRNDPLGDREEKLPRCIRAKFLACLEGR
jgi:DNA-directed RNA polymerase specialized sigma24 family protein